MKESELWTLFLSGVSFAIIGMICFHSSQQYVFETMICRHVIYPEYQLCIGFGFLTLIASITCFVLFLRNFTQKTKSRDV